MRTAAPTPGRITPAQRLVVLDGSGGSGCGGGDGCDDDCDSDNRC